jgi:hypothetical protein
MRIDFSKFDQPQVLDYAPPPAPRTLSDCLSSIVDFFGGLSWCMVIGGLSLVAIGMLIGADDESGMMIFMIGFSVLGLLLSVWTFK